LFRRKYLIFHVNTARTFSDPSIVFSCRPWRQQETLKQAKLNP